ncbi:protein FAM161A [Nasonia vitripennis]|uniref:Protein FAM161A n=1 Tax=Nasonia vitripennis TaxID=7425 RepID=A0A7M7QF53_NASVI|nr:protein FAM161A [Nasonia vitripennis]
MEVHHLSNEQFKQKLDYLKRKQRMLLKNLRNCLEQDEHAELATIRGSERSKSPREKCCAGDLVTKGTKLTLKGKRCNLEESRANSPLLYPLVSFSRLAEDQDFLTYRCKYRDKTAKTRRNEEILSASKDWSSGSESKCSGDSLESDDQEISVETKSLPPRSPKRWHPTLPKPFSFTLSSSTPSFDISTPVEDAEKYMSLVEQQAAAEYESFRPGKKNPAKKRRIRPVPLTSKIPLYDKLMAEKEERSRIVREESVLSLMSQVRPFKLECDRRAHRALTRSSPELSCKRIRAGYKGGTADSDVAGAGFKAKPVPKNLFSTDVYDRMLEDEYFRNLQKRIRAAELMKNSSLPPSMARRNRCKSAVSLRSQKSSSEERPRSCVTDSRDSVALSRGTPIPSERSRSSAMTSVLPPLGNNLAAILRAQASREKLEREIQEQLEEKRREQLLRLRKALIGRKPAWRALRSAARHEHERDLDFRVSLRRDEAREQAERHRFQMEMMLDRVTRIPTLFERYSQDEMMLQSFQSVMQLHPKLHHIGFKPTHNCTNTAGKKKKKKKQQQSNKRQSCSSVDSYVSLASSSRPNSGSLTSSSGTPPSLSRSSVGSRCKSSTPKIIRASAAAEKKKNDRGPLKVSINETAELIEDARHQDEDEEPFSIDSANSQVREEREKRALAADDNEHVEKE